MKSTCSRLAAIAAMAALFPTAAARAAEHAPVGEKPGNAALSSFEGGTVTAEDGAQAGDHLFDRFDSLSAKAKESNEINLDKSTLGLVARKGGERGDLARKLDLVEIRNYEFDKDGEYSLNDVLAILKNLEGEGWKHLVRNRDGKDLNDISVKQDSEGVTKEMVIINADGKDLNLIHVRGNVSVSDMHHLGGLMGGVMREDDGGRSSSSSTTHSSSSSTSNSTQKH